MQKTGFVNKENINSAGIWSLGLLQMDFFYREKPWYAGQFVRKIIPKINLTKTGILYLTTILNKQKQNLLAGLVRDVDKIFLNSEIKLPVINGKINFSFIEKFITELEAERLAELEAYLVVTGLSDYILSEEEKVVLEDFINCEIEWKEFRIGDLFEKLSSKYLGIEDKFKAVSKVKDNIYNIPLVYAKSGDNGIMYWAKENDFTVYKNVLSIIYNGAIATGLVYAQPENTGILAESYFIKLKNYDVDFKVNLFLQRVLEKILYQKYSREYLATWSGKVEHDIIQLPVKNNKADFGMMNTFISAIQKLVIKDVVLYADKKISATKSIIS